MNFNEFLNEKNVNEAFEVHYSDGIRASKKFNNQKQAIDFAKDLIKNKKGLQFVDVFNAGSGFHSTADTDAIVAFWGDGSYTDNVAKKDPKLAAKKIEEAIESEEVSEASKFGAPAGLTKAETKKVAETLAKAISKNDGVKCTVNLKTLEEDSFDLDVDGEEYDGGSYNIYDDGSVVNHAVTPNEIYGKSHSSVEDFIKGLKKPIKESEEVLEAMFSAKDYNKTLVTYAIDSKADEIYIISVDKVINSSFPNLSKISDKRFHMMFGMMLEEHWLKQYDKLPKEGDILPAPKKDKAFEAIEINEAQSADIAAALKDIREFNRGNIKLEDLTKSIAKNLGYKASKGNLEAIEDHLVASEGDNGKLPEDKTVVRELYDLLESVEVNEAKALPLDKLVKMIGDKPSCYDLADFIYTNYDKVTGLRKSMRNEEMDFPSEIEDLVDHYGFDMDDFTDKYGMAAESVVTESRITLKRQYTENYPAKTVGKHAAIRNKIIEALKDGELTKEDFDQLLSGLTEDSKRWLRRNAQFFNVGEEKVALSATGKKILKSIDEAGYRPMTDDERAKKQYKDQQLKRLQDLKKKDEEGKRLRALQQKLHQAKLKKANENNDTNMENKFIYESFAEFVENKLNESNEFLVEAFKSSILAGFIDLRFAPKELYKAFYNYTKVALDQIEDADFIEMSPNAAYKSKDLGQAIVFYVSRSEKANPHAPEDAYYANKTIPSNALLAIANGQNDFFGVSWIGGRYGKGGNSNYGLSNRGNDGNKADTAGIGKKYRSWDATGLSNVKRISEVADVAYVLPLEVVRQKYSTEGIRAARAAAQAGATALRDAKSFKEENLTRYKSILATRIMNDDLDGKVEKAILKCSDLISKAVQAKEFTRYGEMKLGNAPDGREVTLRDATQFMNNLMTDYTDYARNKNEAKKEEEKYGKADSYYEKQAKQKAIYIKERIAKLDNLNIIW